ncbi:MAG: methylenetetrahydrofolate reductase C-terminal domain-containing protein [Spirochaetes bacterium]|nr:methylenetetrahydrofolate reductase C-terminal domain-containing protein [Spirochaetota bacterium]
MIVGDRKPIEEIKEMLTPYKKILLVGCGTCISVCMTGGEKEVGILASELRIISDLEKKGWEITEDTIQRQCEREYIEPLKEKFDQADVVMSMACGVGVQYMAEVFPHKIVLPAVNTTFYGTNVAEGEWQERCAGCGDCVLDKTLGICPVARCSKGLFNGPCGGTDKGKCEVNKDLDCAWYLIYNRLKEHGKLDMLDEVMSIRSWKSSLHGGPRKRVREEAQK